MNYLLVIFTITWLPPAYRDPSTKRTDMALSLHRYMSQFSYRSSFEVYTMSKLYQLATNIFSYSIGIKSLV